MIFLCVLLISTWQLTTAIISIETGSITNGVEMSLKNWYGDSPYSIMVQHEVAAEAGDSKCQFVTTAVKAAIARKQHIGLLTEEQESRALERFQVCLGKLCNNSAMLDAFLQPETFREQIDLLVAIAKLSDIVRGNEDVGSLLNLLIDGELKEILSEVTFPPIFTDGNVTAGLVPYVGVAMKIIQAACTSGVLKVGTLDLPVITEVLVSSLNDRYTSNAISAAEVGEVWNMKTMEEYDNLWKGIGEKVSSPTSSLANTCLDPAVASYNYEKASIARIRQIAVATGICVPGEEVSGMPDLDESFGMVSPDDTILHEYAAAGAPPPEFEYAYSYLEAAPPPPMGDYGDGPPTHSDSSQASAPDSAPSFDGPPV